MRPKNQSRGCARSGYASQSGLARFSGCVTSCIRLKAKYQLLKGFSKKEEEGANTHHLMLSSIWYFFL
jgi:hypothetical protein